MPVYWKLYREEGCRYYFCLWRQTSDADNFRDNPSKAEVTSLCLIHYNILFNLVGGQNQQLEKSEAGHNRKLTNLESYNFDLYSSNMILQSQLHLPIMLGFLDIVGYSFILTKVFSHFITQHSGEALLENHSHKLSVLAYM